MNGTVIALSNEAALVARAAIEPAAFAAIYDHYFSRVYNYVRYHTRDVQSADDLTSLIFERALTRLSGYQPDRGAFDTWLFAIARHALRDDRRTRRRRPCLSLDELDDPAGDEPLPHERATANESSAELEQALERLDERERDVIGLKFGAGLTNRRIAAVTGLGESNVGVILYRAMRRLLAELNPKEQR